MNLSRAKSMRIAELKENCRQFIARHYDWQVVRNITNGSVVSQEAKNKRLHAIGFCNDRETKINAATNILEVMAVKIDL